MKKEYSGYIAKKLSFLLGSFAALGILMTFAVTVGAADLRMADVFLALYSRFFSAEVSDFTYGVVWHLRLPRLLKSDGVFLTNAVIGIWPVRFLGDREMPVADMTRVLGDLVQQQMGFRN